MKLYEIDEAIMACVDAETGEIVDAEKLEALLIEKEEKIENVALWYKNLCAEAKAYKEEKDSFAAKQKAAEAKAESLKNWLDYVLGGESFKTTKVTMSYRKSEQVVIDDIAALDSRFIKVAEPTADKVEIKKALKAGEELAGCHLETKNNISIK